MPSSPKSKVAFVVQRYGAEVRGGAEQHCRSIAEEMARAGRDVHVYTSCAGDDYVTWRDTYKPGVTSENGVTVHRFSVDHPRDPREFARLSEVVFCGNASPEMEVEWMRVQGPYSTPLLDALEQDSPRYAAVIFFCFHYATTYFGVTRCRTRKVLVPLAHDEPSLRVRLFQTLFTKFDAIFFNAEEERTLVRSVFTIGATPSPIVGVWPHDPVAVQDSHAQHARIGTSRWIVYVGRVDQAKGCDALIEYFRTYRARYSTDLSLVVMGTGPMRVPREKGIVRWGEATEQEKWDVLRGAVASVIPSEQESLSLSLLESFSVSRPVLVNGACAVTKGHCIKSNGGLWYNTPEEFAVALEYLRTHAGEAATMGAQGKQYLDATYARERVMERLTAALIELSRA